MDYNLTYRERTIMQILLHYMRSMNSQQIAEKIEVSRPTASKDLKDLVKKGWLIRVTGRRFRIKDIEKARREFG